MDAVGAATVAVAALNQHFVFLETENGSANHEIRASEGWHDCCIIPYE
jgi:hypothetical protein